MLLFVRIIGHYGMYHIVNRGIGKLLNSKRCGYENHVIKF